VFSITSFAVILAAMTALVFIHFTAISAFIFVVFFGIDYCIFPAAFAKNEVHGEPRLQQVFHPFFILFNPAITALIFSHGSLLLSAAGAGVFRRPALVFYLIFTS
jgi:hypothetical protein